MCILTEEIARVSAGVSLIPGVNKLAAIPVLLAGSDQQKKLVCTGIAEGEHRMSYCLTEPSSGSDSAACGLRGQRDGNEWVLSGSKRFITGAGASDLYTYFAVHGSRRGEGQERHRVPSLERHGGFLTRP